MKNVLLVTSPQTEGSNAVTFALLRAKEMGGHLFALAALDPDLTDRVAKSLTNTGFVGERVSDSVIATLEREQRARAEAMLKQIGEQAEREGVTYTAVIEEGEPSEICARLIETNQIAVAVLVAEKRSWLTRFLSRSPAVRLPTFAGCEVKVMED